MTGGIIAAGEGRRLRQAGFDVPKPLVPVVNKPVMQHILELLKRHGITDIVVTLHYLAEEIESLGRSQRHELRSRIAVIIEHLLKLEHSPAVNPRRGWIDTIGRERLNVEDLLQERRIVGITAQDQAHPQLLHQTQVFVDLRCFRLEKPLGR